MSDTLSALGHDSAGLVEQFGLKFERELARIRGVSPDSARGRAVLGAAATLFEEILTQIERSLSIEQSRLRSDLQSAGLSVKALEAQLRVANIALADGARRKRGGVLRAAVKPLAHLMLAVVGGAASGIAQSAADQRMNPATSQVVTTSAVEYAKRCVALDELFESNGVYAFVVGELASNPLAAEASAKDGGSPPLSDGTEVEDNERDEEDDYDWMSSDWESYRDNDGQYRHPDMDPSEAHEWKDKGFSPGDAVEWKASFAPTEAAKWQREDFDAAEATAWSRGRFEVSEAEDWKFNEFDLESALEWREADFDPQEAAYWRDYGFGPGDSQLWRASEIEPYEAQEWDSQGMDEAREWASHGYSASSAVPWIEEGFTPAQASDWEKTGHTPSEAANLRDRGKTFQKRT